MKRITAYIVVFIAFLIFFFAGFWVGNNRTDIKNVSKSDSNISVSETVSDNEEKMSDTETVSDFVESVSSTENVEDFHYIANIHSKKLHSIDCSELPAEYNRVYFKTIEEAHEAGYTDHHKECMEN